MSSRRLFVVLSFAVFVSASLAQSSARLPAHGAGQSVKPLIEVPFEVGTVDEKGRAVQVLPAGPQAEVADVERMSDTVLAEKALAESHKAPAIVKPSPMPLGPERFPLLPLGKPAGQSPRIEMESKSQLPTVGISFVAIPAPSTGPPPPPGVQYIGPVPPDVGIGAGPNQLVVTSNLVISTFDKLGNQLGSSSLSGFFKPLGTFISPWLLSDPVVHYDEYLKRFWITAAAINNSTSQSLVLIALSKSPDATSGWSMASVDMTVDGSSQSGNWCDYPKLGYDTQAIYITCNMFSFPQTSTSQGSAYGKVRIIAKSQFLSPTCCRWYDHWGLPATIQPAIMHRAKNSDGEFLIGASGGGGSGDSLDVYHFPDPIGNPSQFDQTSVSVGGYYTPPGAPQPGNGPLIDTWDARLHFAIWQDGNLSSGQNSLCTSFGTSAACAIFYELNVSGFPSVSVVNNWAMQEENVFFYDPAAEENRNGDKIMVYTISVGGPPGGGGPGAFYVVIPNSQTCTGCAWGAPQGAGALVDPAGSPGPYANFGSGTRNRWGDYLAAAADPDGHGIWVAGEDIATPSQWAVVVGAFYNAYLPKLKVSPTSVNFSDTQGGNFWERDITVSNGGNADLILQSVNLEGSSDFSISFNNCKLGNPNPSKGALEPNQSCVVKVRFKPTGSGAKKATLSICSNVATPCLAPATVSFTSNGPLISQIQPNNGPVVGGAVTVTGDGLSDKFTFDFGGTVATGVACWSQTTCNMTAPAHAAGAVDVIARNGTVSSVATPDDRFTYQAPAITKITPSLGPTTGGQSVELSGVGFYPLMVVKFGSTTVTSTIGGIQTTTVLCPSDVSCPVGSPPGAGSVHITATLSGDTSPETAENLYTYAIFPAITSVTPSGAPVTGGIPVTITGTNFSTAPGGTIFQFGTLSPTNVTCASSTQCTMTAPARDASATYLNVGVTATVDGRTSIGWVGFPFGKPSPPVHGPPCKGTDCQH